MLPPCVVVPRNVGVASSWRTKSLAAVHASMAPPRRALSAMHVVVCTARPCSLSKIAHVVRVWVGFLDSFPVPGTCANRQGTRAFRPCMHAYDFSAWERRALGVGRLETRKREVLVQIKGGKQRGRRSYERDASGVSRRGYRTEESFREHYKDSTRMHAACPLVY